MLLKIAKILVFSSIFLTDYRIFGVPFTSIVFLLCIAIVLLFHKSKSIKPIFLKENLKIFFLIILALSILTYIIKFENNEYIKQIYYNNSGFKPDFLYVKMAMNGCVFILSALLAFSIGVAFKGENQAIKKILNYIINLITLNAVINIIAWGIQTGGVISRYNFSLPITSSFGINIQWSILGFILLLSNIKSIWKLNLQTCKLIILLFSILIIVSRQNQLMFILMVVIYLNMTSIKTMYIRSFAFLIALIFVIVYFGQSIVNVSVINSYQKVLNPQGADLLIRFNTIISALDIFKENLIFGVGYGMYGGYNTSIVTITSALVSVNSPHNGVISILTEMGIIGLIFIIAMTFKIQKRLNFIKNNMNINEINQNKYIIALYVFITLNIFSALISNYFLFPPPSEYSYYGIASISWLLIGVLFSISKQKSLL